MLCIGYACDECKHQLPNKDGWICVCEAFPDRIPNEIIFGKPKDLPECNNGIGFEPKHNNSAK